MPYREITFDKRKLRGYLHQHEVHKCLVIMLHGFTGNKNDNHFMFRSFGREIHDEGYDVFRFDFLGSGDSDGDFEEISISSQIEQCLQVVEYFKDEYDQVHLFGFSLGGVIAAKFSAKYPDIVASLFLLSPAFNFNNILQMMVDDKERVHDAIDMNGFLITNRFMQEVAAYDYVKEIGHYKNSLMVMIGLKDECIPVNVVKHAMRQYQQDFEFVEVEGANHCYTSIRYTQEVKEELKKFYRRMKDGNC